MTKGPTCIESMPVRHTAVLILTAMVLSACATAPASRDRNGSTTAASRDTASTFHVKEAHAVDNPCDVSRQRMKQVGGSILGAIIGFGACRLAGEVVAPNASTADKNRVSAGCAVLGGLAGYTWTADATRRQCEVYQVAQRNRLNAAFQEVTVIEPVSVTASATTPAASRTGGTQETTVSVMTLPGAGLFAQGSATLTPQARQYFAAIAQQYTYPAQADSLRRSLPPDQQAKSMTPDNMNTLRRDWDRIRLVLVGHTDDTGGDAINSTLSEQRARAVAEVFRTSGVTADRLFYQGAGSSLPIGDNRTEDGRARNRRVDVIELPPDADVARYLSLRKPNPDFFRPLPSGQIAAPARKAQAVSPKPRAGKPAPRAVAATSFDFGGVPASPVNKAVADALGRPESTDSSWGFVQSAKATDEPIYAVACTRDSPDVNQSLPAKQLGTGQAAVDSTREFLPGFNDASWLGSVNGHGVGLSHVAILRDGDRPASNPDVRVYRDMDRTGDAQADFTASSQVRVYEGEKALLYRVFVYSGELKCLDIVVPESGSQDARLGTIYYEHDRELLAAPYAPKRVRAQ